MLGKFLNVVLKFKIHLSLAGVLCSFSAVFHKGIVFFLREHLKSFFLCHNTRSYLVWY